MGVINIDKGIQHKINNILELCTENSYHFMGLTEIGLVPNITGNKPQRSIHNSYNSYSNQEQKFYSYLYDDQGSRDLGIGFIINEHLQKHITKITIWKNRMMTISLNFRKNIKVIIIIIYLPVDNNDYKITNDIHQELYKIIDSTNRETNSELIIMGDFNIDIKEIKNKPNSNKNWRAKKQIIQMLKQFHLNDITQYHQDKPMNCQHTLGSKQHKTR
jgi:exonuclease III